MGASRDPVPLLVGEQLPESDEGRCRTPACKLCWLYYQRIHRPTYPRHFFFCRRCGARYRAAEPWTPGRAASGDT